ncbi:hypothetical protein ACN47E_002743 [Coniothyrium glycines]
MVQDKPSSTTAFNSIPIELNKTIAHNLDADKDVAAFRLICRATNDAIDADNCSFWRAKFREKYALKEGVDNSDLMQIYQRRAKLLHRGTSYNFFRGHQRRENDVVKVLRGLIVEAFQGCVDHDEHGRPYCKNQTQLLNFIINSKIFLNDRRAPPVGRGESDAVHPLLAAVKLICSQFLFELKGARHNVFGIEESQRAVYLSAGAAPIYKGPNLTDVNMEWVLHCLNFFRHHMMCEDTATLFDNIKELPATQKPSRWREPLRNGAYPLSKHWKGTYSYIHWPEMKKLRELKPDDALDEFISDKNVDEGKIQSLTLNFDLSDSQKKWPPVFEKYLQSLRHTAEPIFQTQGRSKSKNVLSDIKSKSIQFIGEGEDLDDDFSAVGWLNPLPTQQGIPGWKRITFMKHFLEDVDDHELDNLWAYEGVVLPGGRIILGRWWFCTDQGDAHNDYNGPFILWAVDPEPDLDDGSDGE